MEVLKVVTIENDTYKIEQRWKRTHAIMFGHVVENRLLKNDKCIRCHIPFFEKDEESSPFFKLEEIIKDAKSLNKKIAIIK